MAKKAVQSANAYIASPVSGKGAGVLVIHAWWGLNEFIKRFCHQLAKEGFVAMAPDLFEGHVADNIMHAKRLRAMPKREPTYKTLIRSIEQLSNHPAIHGSHIGVIGFSMGGHWALWLSQRPELPIGATVTFYGARAGDYSNSQSAFMGHFAEQDEWVSDASLKKLRRDLQAAGRSAEFFIYPGTGHWFFESDRVDVFNSQAAELAWERTLGFLRKHLKPGT